MNDIILKIYDDNEEIIYQQTLFNIEDYIIDKHARKLVEFFMAKDYETFHWNPNKKS